MNTKIQWLFLLVFFSSSLFGQWDYKFSFDGASVLLDQDNKDKIILYTDQGYIISYDGAKVKSSRYFEGQVYLLKKIDRKLIALTSEGLYFLDDAEKISIPKAAEVKDFEYFNGYWYILNEQGVYSIQDHRLMPEYLLENEKPISLKKKERCLHLFTSKQILELCDNHFIKKSRFEREVEDVVHSMNTTFVASDNSIYKFNGDNLSKLILHDPSESVLVDKLFVHGANAYYQSKNKIFRFPELERFEIPEPGIIDLLFVDKSDNFWLSINEKIFLKDHNTEIDDRPNLYIDEIFINGEVFIGDTIILNSKDDVVQVNLGLTGYSKRTANVYSYYNEVKNKWSEPSNETLLTIEGWKKGFHQLKFRSQIGHEEFIFLTGPQIVIKNESIDKVLYIAIFSLLGLLMLAFGFQVRNSNQIKLLEKERDQLRVRNELLVEREKVLQLQMSPHFLSNTLNSISGMIALEQRSKARKYLGTFSQLMRQVLEQNAQQFINLSEEYEYLENYLLLEKMMCNDSFNFDLKISIDSPELHYIKPMLIQPFIENSIIHGLKRGEIKGGNIDVVFKKQNDRLLVTIEDNGIGFENKDNKRTSHAMFNVKKRLSTSEWYNVIERKDKGERGVSVELNLLLRNTKERR